MIRIEQNLIMMKYIFPFLFLFISIFAQAQPNIQLDHDNFLLINCHKPFAKLEVFG